jgi:DNA-binding NarL/FixJ family response regulator
MDVNLPGINGFEATEYILKQCPQSKVLGISLHAQPAYAKKMMQAGAMGYLTKNSTTTEMFRPFWISIMVTPLSAKKSKTIFVRRS